MNEDKIGIVGIGGVGKTALTLQFVKNQWIENYDPSIEDNRKQIAVDDQVASLDIRDTEGQEKHIRYNRLRVHSSQGFVLVYSVTSRSSFDEISCFKEDICRLKDTDHVPMILIGNKSDLEDQREVSANGGAALAASWNISFLETSAKLRVNVDELFCDLVRQIRLERNRPPPADNNRKKGGPFSTKCCIL